ncbi:: VPEP [Gemmataceae bacterium]|nr:: VPEP [Gemmataceae bacterium]VTT96741.1 : VPEP [Gemmataceae bacterium]
MLQRTWIMGLLGAGLVAVAVNAPARAGLIPGTVTVQSESGAWRWTYSVAMPKDMKLQAGDYFTVYDFKGFTGDAGVTSPFPDDSYKANWTVSTSNLGKTPDRLSPDDDPNVTNLTWTYTGPDLVNPTGGSIGNFFAVSTFDKTASGSFTGTTHITDVNAPNYTDNNVTSTLVPTGTDVPPGVPEPTTLALLGIGLPLVGGARVLRRRRAA